MRLASLVPSISAELVAGLNTIGIRTESDLLLSDSPYEIYKRLPTKTVSLEDLEATIDKVAELSAAPAVSCYDLYVLDSAHLHGRDTPLVSGNEEIDRILAGIGRHKLIQISGEKGCGKSILTLNIAINLLARNNESTVAWIDTTGDFSIEAPYDILNEKQIAPAVLDRLQVSLAFNLETAQAALEHIFQSGSTPPHLLVIDCITPLLASLLSAASAQGHAIMTDFMRHVRYLAQISRTTVLLLNSTARKSMDTQERKPALGPTFALMVDSTFWLQSTKQENSEAYCHSFQVLSTRSMASLETVVFRFNSNVVV